MGHDPTAVGAQAPDTNPAAPAVLVTRDDDAAAAPAPTYDELVHRLQETEARLRALEATFEAVADGVFVMDGQGRVLQMNSAGQALFNVPAPEGFYALPLAERGYRVTVMDDRGSPLPEKDWPFARIMRGETLTGSNAPDVRLRAPDGREFELNVSGAPVRDLEGRVVASVSICRDVTERRRLERRTNDALAALLKMAESLVLDPGQTSPNTDRAGGYEQASRAMVKRIAQRLAELTCSVLGCSRVAILAIEPETERQRPLAVAGLAPELERQWWAGQEQQEAHLGDGPDQAAVARLRAGETLIFDMTRPPFEHYPNPYAIRTVLVAPMRVGEQVVGLLSLDYGGAEHEYTPDELSLAGAVARLAALVIERERLVDARAAAQASELALREANRRMDEFLSMVSHELKNPLAGIKVTTQVAARRLGGLARETAAPSPALAEGVERTLEMLARADSQVVRLTRLVNDLVDVSRIQEGKLALDVTPCDLAEVVRQVVEEQRQTSPERGIELTLPLTAALPVAADTDRIAQVVTNYLTNAVKYSPPETPIAVRVAREVGEARVAVRDEGPGLTPEQCAHVWERGYRAHGAANKGAVGAGLGLGLHISRSIVEAHGGRVGLESAPGQGATFWFTLPCGTMSADES